MTIYERIKNLRLTLGMSQTELAKRVGYEGRSAISKVENGERDISQSMIEKYAKALNVSPTYLLYGNNYKDFNDEWLSSSSSGEVHISLFEACNIADAIGTSLDYMVGLKQIDSKTLEFINLFAQLTMEQQSLVISQIKGILSNQ